MRVHRPEFAVGEGFEPPNPFGLADYQSAAINHSSHPQKNQVLLARVQIL
jgi:hypothetical protein